MRRPEEMRSKLRDKERDVRLRAVSALLAAVFVLTVIAMMVSDGPEGRKLHATLSAVRQRWLEIISESVRKWGERVSMASTLASRARDGAAGSGGGTPTHAVTKPLAPT
jgi:hypothetical protein